MCTSLPGFEPGIFWSVVRRVIRCATSPVLTMARFSLYKPSSVSDLLFVWREIWTACMHYRPKYGDVKPKQPTSPCRVLLLSATGGFSALKSVYGNVRHMKLCVKCQYCLHCESNHSFRWMPIALKDWTYILGGLAADVFQEKCEQNEKSSREADLNHRPKDVNLIFPTTVLRSTNWAIARCVGRAKNKTT